MKLRALEVKDFGRIARARLELGDGLNVLYGPNDLGKSTLAQAIRAALLLPPTSSAASELVPWDRDAVPEVALTFELGEGTAKVRWKVVKTFGSSTRGTARLERSDDEGKTFAVDAKSREVDGRLRELLGWGVASPGGKGAPRGLPESFLTQALLGAQSKSDALFAATLDQDTDDAGRANLTRALEAYAQDPVFKEILLRAQARVDEAFSTSGRKRTGKASPFREPGEAVKEAQREHERAQEALERAERAIHDAARLQEALARAMEDRDEAERSLGEAEAAHAATAAHEAAARA
ncbi:MAG: AAA family ATPase, partial [Myxococcales bacterium]|nr:AAA family ATPase [Myxococcales bacterium]